MDDDYRALLEQEVLADKFKTEKYSINCGQDFETHYIGSFHIDMETKRYNQWVGKSSGFSEQDVKILAESLFDPDPKIRYVTMFAPTRPSDINLRRT